MFENKVNFPFQVLKAVVFSLLFALCSVFVFAMVLRFVALPDSVIKPVVGVLKTLCGGLGALLFVRGDKGLLKGALIGVFSVLATRLLFSAFCGFYINGFWILIDLLINAVACGICGVIAVNLKRE